MNNVKSPGHDQVNAEVLKKIDIKQFAYLFTVIIYDYR